MKLKIRKELLAMKKQMITNQVIPPATIIPNGQPHFYMAKDNKRKLRVASYTAILIPFDGDLDGPLLIGWYSFINENKQYHYSSLKK